MNIFLKFKSESEYLHNKEKIRNFTKSIKRGNLHRDKKDKDVDVTYGLASIGFEEIKFRKVNDKDYKYYCMEIILRPKLLVEKGNYVNVLYAHEISKARERFNFIIQEVLGLDLPDFIYWKVKRIDYAVDLSLCEHLIIKYLFYFKKGNLPTRVLNHPHTAKYFHEQNNCYLCSDTYTFNIYARYITLLDKQLKLRKEFLNVDAAKNIMRVEVQYHIDTFRLKQQGKIPENELRYFLNIDLCQSIIEYHFNSIIGQGNYYTLEKAIEIINQKVPSFRERILMERMLRLIAKEGSVWAAKLSYVSNSENKEKALKEFSRIINRIRDNGVNPVTLSNEPEINELSGLGDKIHAYFFNAKGMTAGYSELEEDNVNEL